MAEYTKADREQLGEQLAAVCRRCLGSGDVSGLTQLSGGASMESWRFCFASRDWVLRRLPGLSANLNVPEGVAMLSLADQALLLQHVYRQGVSVPEVLTILLPEDGVGDGFVMACVAGEALPQKLLSDPAYTRALGALSKCCAAELAKIHGVPADALPIGLTMQTPREAVKEQEYFYAQHGSLHPVFSLAFAWLSENAPGVTRQVVVHGDFRLGNFLMDHAGLTAVLDWELSHLGDPIRDVAFFCAPSWRFGRYHLEAAGVAPSETWIKDYESATQTEVDRAHFTWWLVFNTLWWGVACMRMAATFRDGSVATMERAVIGRRISEVAIDLLLLLEPLRGKPFNRLAINPPQGQPPAGDITPEDLLLAVRAWNKGRLKEEQDEHRLFEARVANNAMGIVARELAFGHTLSRQEQARMDALGATNEELAQRLRQRSEFFADDRLWDHLRLSAIEQLWIDQPRYAGLTAALAKWGST